MRQRRQVEKPSECARQRQLEDFCVEPVASLWNYIPLLLVYLKIVDLYDILIFGTNTK